MIAAQNTKVIGPFTIVEAVVIVNDVPIYAVGVSRCSTTDRFDAREGYEQALGRAKGSAYLKASDANVYSAYMG